MFWKILLVLVIGVLGFLFFWLWAPTLFPNDFTTKSGFIAGLIFPIIGGAASWFASKNLEN